MSGASYVGSKHFPDVAILKEAIVSLRSSAGQLLNDDDFIAAHNEYVAYVANFLMYVTGHRAVRDLFAILSEIDVNIGLCVINDKLVNEEHANRLVCIPPTACEQIREYKRHLYALAQHLSVSNNIGLARSVLDLCEEEMDQQPIPFLFFLKRDEMSRVSLVHLSESSLKMHIGSIWPYKMNMGRTVLSSLLREKKVLSELINIQMGHLDVFKQPFGRSTIISPIEARIKLTPVLEELIQDLGWDVLPGMAELEKRNVPIRYLDSETQRYKPIKLWGAKRRKEIREQQTQKDKAIIRMIVLSIGQKGFEKDPSMIEVARKRVIESSSDVPERIKKRTYLYWRYMRYLKCHKWKIELPSRQVYIQTEPSPFPDSCLKDYNHAIKIRKKYEEYIIAQAKNYSDVSEEKIAHRMALVVIAAVLEDVICNEKYIAGLIEALPDKVYEIDGLLMVNIQQGEEHDKKQRWHWFPHDIGRGLLIGMFELQKNELGAVNNKDILKEMVSILNQCDLNVTQKNVFSKLGKASFDYWRMYLSGFVREIAKGNQAHQPLPMTAMVRLLQDRRLDLGGGVVDKDEVSVWLPEVTPKWKKTTEECQDFYKKLLDCIKTTRATKPKGYDRHNKGMKKTLALEIKNKFEHKALPPLIAALVGWTHHLATKGTKRKKDIAFGTVDKYWRIVTKALLEKAYDKDFLDMQQGEYEELYLDILDYSEDDQNEIAGRLMEFHHYLHKFMWVEDLGMTINGKGAVSDRLPIDANIVTPKEYERIFSLIDQYGDFDEKDKLTYLGIFIVGYRFKLRIDEALKLQPKDILCYEDLRPLGVHVGKNIHGDVKTVAALRIAPDIVSMSEREYKVLMLLRDRSKEWMKEDQQACIFASAENPRKIIDRFRVYSVLHTAMRQVTGDKTIRYHHLRHSSVNADLFYLLPNEHNKSAWFKLSSKWLSSDFDDAHARRVITGKAETTSAILPALALQVGHARPTSTIGTYWHFADAYIHGISGNSTIAPFSDRVMEYVLYKSNDAIRSRRTDYGIDSSDSVRLANTYSLKKFVKAPPFNTSTHPKKEKLLNVASGKVRKFTLRDIDTILSQVRYHKGSEEGIARRYLISNTRLDEILSLARKAERDTGYTRFGLVDLDRGNKSSKNIDMDTGFYSEQIAIRKSLDIWQKRISSCSDDEIKAIKSALTKWEYATKKNSSIWIFNETNQVEECLAGLEIIGIYPKDLDFLIPEMSSRYKLDAKLKLIKNQYNFSGVVTTKLPLADEKIADLKRQRIGIRLAPGKKVNNISYPRRLSRLLFILTIAMRLDQE